MAAETDHPRLYFRVRENGATVFRLDTENRMRRLEMDQIAVVNINNGQIRPHSATPPTADEMAQIRAWMEERRRVLAERAIDDIFRTIDHLNLTAQWAQSKAGDADLERFTEPLLLAMHDLRMVLVRKKAERMERRLGED